MKLSEVFQSHQGEGLNLGQYCTFIRFSGCNLSCSFCDTKYATDGYEATVEDILPNLTGHLVFTGGEPFLQENVIYDILDAKEPEYSEVETNGTIIPNSPDRFNLITVSPKTDINYQEWLDNPNTIFKFPTLYIEPVLDIVEREAIPKDRVFVMPITSRNFNNLEIHQDLSKQCRAHNFNFSPRLQVLLNWGAGL